jgi:hypothetical protein
VERVHAQFIDKGGRFYVKFAEQTNGRLAHIQFGDGHERWVVFKSGRPIGAFRGYDGDLAEALQEHERVRSHHPRTIRATFPAEKMRRGSRRIFSRARRKKKSAAKAGKDKDAVSDDWRGASVKAMRFRYAFS